MTNPEPTTGGSDAEPDDRLRDRAKHALERAGNATVNAIAFAVRGVDGVNDVQVLDTRDDPAIPLGEVRVRFDGGDADEVRDVVDRTRAAGVLVRAEQVERVEVTGVLVVVPSGAPAAAAAASGPMTEAVAAAIDALPIGQPLIVRRLVALAYGRDGVAEIAEAQLRWRRRDPDRPGGVVAGDVDDPFLVEPHEFVRSDRDELRTVVLAGLQAAPRPVAPGATEFVLDLGLLDATGARVAFRRTAVEVRVTARAIRRDNPTDTPQSVGSFTATALFAGGSPAGERAALTVQIARDLPRYRRAEHLPDVALTIVAPAWDALTGAETTVTLA